MAWLIERYINSELRYWCGHAVDDFRPLHGEAIRFSREADANVVLAWLCGGQGRSVEHKWIRVSQGDPEAMNMPDPYDGRPYYCEICGLGYSEFIACEEGECQLESLEKAILRKESAGATRKR